VSRARVILVGGLIAAALDITYACIVYGPLSFHLSPTEVLQSVASGWVGNDAANAGGAVMAQLRTEVPTASVSVSSSLRACSGNER